MQFAVACRATAIVQLPAVLPVLRDHAPAQPVTARRIKRCEHFCSYASHLAGRLHALVGASSACVWPVKLAGIL